ncbi:MAG: hypothetical protein HY365_02965 [Candidatus Aenigmarchaeota archaeon]|nr:hypothetical protein [Candidatus Aenigmarchaeota archaeon]
MANVWQPDVYGDFSLDVQTPEGPGYLHLTADGNIYDISLRIERAKCDEELAAMRVNAATGTVIGRYGNDALFARYPEELSAPGMPKEASAAFRKLIDMEPARY